MTRRLSLTSEAIKQLTIQPDPWLSCDDCFDRVDLVVEGLLKGTAAISDEFRTHLLGCPACHQETQTLVSLVAAEYDVDAGLALAELEASVHGRR
jgi:hypothetical protein